jgi:hypothetical protein
MVDALEAGITALCSHSGNASPRESNSISPAALLAEMEKFAISAVDLAAATGVAHGEVEDWLTGARPIPSWISAIIRVTGLLPSPARRRLRSHVENPSQQRLSAGSHPFSRIEEL